MHIKNRHDNNIPVIPHFFKADAKRLLYIVCLFRAYEKTSYLTFFLMIHAYIIPTFWPSEDHFMQSPLFMLYYSYYSIHSLS